MEAGGCVWNIIGIVASGRRLGGIHGGRNARFSTLSWRPPRPPEPNRTPHITTLSLAQYMYRTVDFDQIRTGRYGEACGCSPLIKYTWLGSCGVSFVIVTTSVLQFRYFTPVLAHRLAKGDTFEPKGFVPFLESSKLDATSKWSSPISKWSGSAGSVCCYKRILTELRICLCMTGVC
jgi:hypothetical protein